MAQLILLPGKERSAFKQHHPWLFAGSVGRLEGRARPGDTVEVLADNLRPLGRAAYSPKSQIRARFWTFDGEESIDDAFFKRVVAKKSKKDADKFFAAAEKPKNTISEARKAAQKTVDAGVLAAVKKVPELDSYLKTRFTLTKGLLPHKLKF